MDLLFFIAALVAWNFGYFVTMAILLTLSALISMCSVGYSESQNVRIFSAFFIAIDLIVALFVFVR